MKGLVTTLRRCIHSQPRRDFFLYGYRIRGPSHIRVARERNRLAAILRHAKAIPPRHPFAPVTGERLPLTRQAEAKNSIAIASTVILLVRTVGRLNLIDGWRSRL